MPESGGESVAARNGVTFRELPPPALLRPHVWSLWVHRVASTDPPYRHREVPAGSAHVVCDSTGCVELLGPQTAATETTIEPGTTVVGARLRPGTRLERLSAPAGDLIDTSVTLDGWSRHGMFDRDNEWTAGAAMLWLTRQLAVRLAQDGVDDTSRAVDRLVRTAGESFEPAVSMGVSPRQARRRFHARVGMPARTLHRLLRFQLVLREIQRTPGDEVDLADLAVTSGYADQAHLSRECVRLSGTSPRRLVADTQRYCGPQHDHAPAFAPLRAAAGPR